MGLRHLRDQRVGFGTGAQASDDVLDVLVGNDAASADHIKVGDLLDGWHARLNHRARVRVAGSAP